MRWFLTVLFLVVFAAGTVAAQEAFRFAAEPFTGDATRESDTPATSGEGEYSQSQEGTASYESWSTEDGRSAVQKKAMFRAEQLQLRIASRKWYGFSQSRPVVAAVPYMSNYAPLWAGRHWHPYYTWYGTTWR